MMKMLNSNRRRLDSAGGDGGSKSPATLFWMILHWLCCLISLLLGFRFSRLVMFLLFSSASTNPAPIATISTSGSVTASFAKSAGNLAAANSALANGVAAGSRVAVGRHGIRIRPWPHPNPEEVMRAHRILEEVQREQRIQYGVKEPRSVIAITPTFVRTFQTLHLTGVMHSLMNCPYEVVWIVVEAGGKTAETASLIGKSGLQTIHIGFHQKMPETWADRRKTENDMRILALRTVRSNKLDGIVIFADDSNIHSTDLFDEIQKVRKIGAFSVGILTNDTVSGKPPAGIGNQGDSTPAVMGPSCQGSNSLAGLEWAGFALNSRLLWNEDAEMPERVKDLEGMEGNGKGNGNPLFLLKDHSVVEPLGDCGQRVLVWWVRAEARSDSRFPPGWVTESPLEMTVATKRTPWPDVPPELPDVTPKSRMSKSKHSRNRGRREPVVPMV